MINSNEKQNRRNFLKLALAGIVVLTTNRLINPLNAYADPKKDAEQVNNFVKQKGKIIGEITQSENGAYQSVNEKIYRIDKPNIQLTSFPNALALKLKENNQCLFDYGINGTANTMITSQKNIDTVFMFHGINEEDARLWKETYEFQKSLGGNPRYNKKGIDGLIIDGIVNITDIPDKKELQKPYQSFIKYLANQLKT